MIQLRRIAREERQTELFLVLRAQGDETRLLKELGFDGATDYANAYTPVPGEHTYRELIEVATGVWRRYEGRRSN